MFVAKQPRMAMKVEGLIWCACTAFIHMLPEEQGLPAVIFRGMSIEIQHYTHVHFLIAEEEEVLLYLNSLFPKCFVPFETMVPQWSTRFKIKVNKSIPWCYKGMKKRNVLII